MPGLMSGSSRAKRTPSITNNICNLGGDKKGGLISMMGRNPNLSNVIRNNATYCNCNMPLGCVAGLAYLTAKNLLTRNPQGSGGIPTRMYNPGRY
jgi:hypothetical protein